MVELTVRLRELVRQDLAVIEPWFRDPDTERYLGGPGWPTTMLAQGGKAVGKEFRGAVQTGAYRYLAQADCRPIGYIDCGTFDRCTVYDGKRPDGPATVETIDLPTGSIAFAIEPQLRRRGLGHKMIEALLDRPELRFVELFEAGVEPDNSASRCCLRAAGFRARSQQPDYEGMLYYRWWRSASV